MNCNYILDKKVYDRFTKYLKTSIERNGIISEDTVRYLFYIAAIKGLKLNDSNIFAIQQEVSYEDSKLKLSKKNKTLLKTKNNTCLSELDTYIDFEEKYAIEFKYHRILSKVGKNKKIPHTDYVGYIINDLNRLSIIGRNFHRMFVYVMDDGMISHLSDNKKYGKRFFHQFKNCDINSKMSVCHKNIKKYEPHNTRTIAYDSFVKGCTGLKNFNIQNIYSKSFKVKTENYKIMIFELT